MTSMCEVEKERQKYKKENECLLRLMLGSRDVWIYTQMILKREKLENLMLKCKRIH